MWSASWTHVSANKHKFNSHLAGRCRLDSLSGSPTPNAPFDVGLRLPWDVGAPDNQQTGAVHCIAGRPHHHLLRARPHAPAPQAPTQGLEDPGGLFTPMRPAGRCHYSNRDEQRISRATGV